jgi:hypothetical protein
MRLEQFDLVQLSQRQQAGAHAIVDVMGVVGDLVGEVAQLRFQGRLGMVRENDAPHRRDRPPRSCGR